jgi:hypothetical protein
MKTHRTDIPSMLIFIAVLLFVIVVLLRLIETTPTHPILGGIAAIAFLGLMWLLTGLSLKS